MIRWDITETGDYAPSFTDGSIEVHKKAPSMAFSIVNAGAGFTKSNHGIRLLTKDCEEVRAFQFADD
jgi:hypothetical protein